jgi:hypothetical protein
VSRFKTPDEAATFMNAQVTREYKRKLWVFFQEVYGEKFCNEMKPMIKKEKSK